MQRLPSLKELHHDVQQAFEHDQLNLLLNQPPHKDWLKKFPAEMGIKGEYLPIDKIQFLLTRIFQQWRVEVINYSVLFQSVAVHVRLHYTNPLTGQWQSTDGVGGCPVQTNAGKSAADLAEIKTRAVQMALPIAKTAAIKDAAEELGTLFGRDLNRKDTVQFAGAYGGETPPPATPTYPAGQVTQQAIKAATTTQPAEAKSIAQLHAETVAEMAAKKAAPAPIQAAPIAATAAPIAAPAAPIAAPANQFFNANDL